MKFVLDNDESMLNQEVEIDGEQTYVTTLKTVSLDSEIAEILSKHIVKGRAFNSEDYTIVDENIPVILGSDYAGIYSIGDTIKANYLSLNVSFEIIAFFEENTELSILNQNIILNNYICLPSFDADLKLNDSNKKFLQIYNIQKNCGYILIEDECSEEMIEKYRNDVYQLAREYNLYYDIATLQTNIYID